MIIDLNKYTEEEREILQLIDKFLKDNQGNRLNDWLSNGLLNNFLGILNKYQKPDNKKSKN